MASPQYKAGPEWVAANRVRMRISAHTGGVNLQVATNAGWEPPDSPPEGSLGFPDYGVPARTLGGARSTHTLVVAGQALVQRLQEALGGHLTLREWVTREEGKRGGDGSGLARLAADLLGLRTIPRRVAGRPYKEQSSTWKSYAAELRKLEEYRQGKYLSASGARRGRIAQLRGAAAGNPYRPIASLDRLLQRYRVVLSARADWNISNDYWYCHRKNTDIYPYPSPAHDALISGGRDLLENIADIITDEIGQPINVACDIHEARVYTLYVQLSGPPLPGKTEGQPPTGPRKHKPQRKTGGGREIVL